MMSENTTINAIQPTVTLDGTSPTQPPADLVRRYEALLECRRLAWTVHPCLIRMLGKGGQGIVFLSERRGADGFTVPIALKLFSPDRYDSLRSYDQAMLRIAGVAAHIAQIQHDNLLQVQDFYDRDRIRIMAMEYVDGYDLRSLLNNGRLERIRDRVSRTRWEYINRVIVTHGERQLRMTPGFAVAVVRDCLAALAALHREGIVHGDIKPSNVMLKRTGSAKIIDIGSAFALNNPPAQRTCTPAYAAPEVLDGEIPTPRSDLSGLGYLLIELLAGKALFSGLKGYHELLEAKRTIHHRLEDFLPEEVTCNELLMGFCRRLVAPDPSARFPNAEAAELVEHGAAAFHRQLVLSDLAAEYGNEIRLWLEEVRELDLSGDQIDDA